MSNNKKVYGLKIPSEQKALFEAVLSKEESIAQIFGKEWINKSIRCNYKDRNKIHPLFWILIRDNDFIKKLTILEQGYGKFISLINHLKNDIANIYDIVSNINVYYEYKLTHSQVFFQPQDICNNKECDVKVIIESAEYWGEILSINPDEENRVHDKLNDYIRLQYNEKNESNTCVFINYNYFLTEEVKHGLEDFLWQESRKLSLAKGEEISREFIVNNNVYCVVNFFGKGDKYKKGYYGGVMSPGQFMRDDIRIKNKLRDKLDKFQFPTQDEIKRFFVLFLKGSADIIDVDNAMLGQECVIFNSYTNDHEESRARDGIVHDPQRSRKLDKIDFIVINDQDGKKYYRFNVNKSLSKEFIRSNF